MTDAGERKIARKSQAAVRRLVVLTLALVAVVLLGVTALLTAGSRLLDELQVNEDRALIANAVDRISTRLVSDMTTVTVWDQAYRNMRPGGDPVWADAEVGGYFANNRAFDLTVAIDEHDTPFYAWVGKHRAAPASQAQFVADAMPLIHQLRATEAAHGAYRPKAEPTDPTLAETAKGIMVSSGRRYLIGASTVEPTNGATTPRAGPATVVISALALDQRILYSLRRMRGGRPAHRRRPPTPPRSPPPRCRSSTFADATSGPSSGRRSIRASRSCGPRLRLSAWAWRCSSLVAAVLGVAGLAGDPRTRHL